MVVVVVSSRCSSDDEAEGEHGDDEDEVQLESDSRR